MVLAAQKGFLDVVKWLYAEYHADPRINLFGVCGHLDDEFGYSKGGNGYDDSEQIYCSAVDVAAANGHLEIVQYLLQVGREREAARDHKRRRTQKIPDYVVRGEPRWLSSQELPDEPTKLGCTTTAMDGAAAHGHSDVVHWLHANCAEGCTTAAMDLAAQNGHVEMVKWLHHNRMEGCTSDAMDAAARGGHLDVVKWLHEHRSEGCTTVAMDNAATGHLEIVRWLHENRAEGCTAAGLDGAAAYGEMKVVKWLHRNRPEGCTTLAMDNAAHGGHLRVLRWLYENRKEGFTERAMDNAARFAQFESLLILHGIAQQGLAKKVETMDDETSGSWITERYREIVRTEF